MKSAVTLPLKSRFGQESEERAYEKVYHWDNSITATKLDHEMKQNFNSIILNGSFGVFVAFLIYRRYIGVFQRI
jgi:hypothetical protein